MIGILFPLAVVALVVWLVQGRRRGGTAPDLGVHTLRRALQYGFLAAALFAAVAGLTRLVASALPSGALAQRGATDLALGVSLTVVAVPIGLLLWRLVHARLDADPQERAAPAWALYLVVVVGVSLVSGFVRLIEVGRWIIGVESYAAEPVAAAVVWTATWALHTHLLASYRLRPTARPVVLASLIGASVGLVGIAVGGGGVVAAALRELYRSTVGPPLLETPLWLTLGTSVLTAALGGVVWWWYWWRQVRPRDRDVLWHGYVLLFGVLGGLLTAVISAGRGVHAVLQWWLGVPEAVTAVAHFDLLPSTLAATIVGLWSWRYHRSVLDTGPMIRREPERIYDHLVSAVGLLATAAGVTVTIMAAVQAATPGVLATDDPGGRNALVAAMTLLLLGAPIWGVFWRRIQHHARADQPAEQRSPTRRSYLVLLFGMGALTAAVSLAVILFVVIRDGLEQRLELTVLFDLRAAIGLVVTAAAIAAYHAARYRADRRVAPNEQTPHPRDVLLVSSDGRALVQAIAAGTGAHVHGLHRLDAGSSPIDAEQVSAAIRTAPHDRLLVVVDDDGVRVIPYDPV